MAILGEVFSIIRNGASIKQIDGANGFPITRIETISNRVIDRNRLGYANVFDITEYESYVLQSGDILMSHINSEKHLGKTALYIKKGNEKIIHGMNLLMLRANSEVILPLYAKYFFDSNLFLKQIPNITKKSVNQASFTVTALKKLEIKIPQMVEQKRIIDIMSRLDNIIQYRKDQLEKLDLFVKSKFVSEGIDYDQLSDDDKKRYEEDFTEDGTNDMPEYIAEGLINKIVFNRGTVDRCITDLMERGIKINGGDKLGKSIIFAATKEHARYIVERFDKLYPQYAGHFASVVVCEDDYAQSIIDDFKVPDKNPFIAVSVDMMDTGIDVPELVNLVFFKKVHSKTKFWQMIGRGTRLCENLNCVDSKNGEYEDKKYFFIFDYGQNFEFFRAKKNGVEGNKIISLTESIFIKQITLIKAMQEPVFGEEKYQAFRNELIDIVVGQILALNKQSVVVRLKRRYVEAYNSKEAFQCLSSEAVGELCKEIAPLVYNEEQDEYAKRFDNFMYGLMIAFIEKRSSFNTCKNQLTKTAELLEGKSGIPQVKNKLPEIKLIQSDEYWKANDILLFENTRKELRDLIQLLYDGRKTKIIKTVLTDPIVETKEGEVLPIVQDFENYKKKVNRYIEENKDSLAIFKLTHNKPITDAELHELQNVFLKKLGNEADYKREFKDTPVGILVRNVAGMDKESVRDAFTSFINSQKLNQNQIVFVEKLIDYVCANGYVKTDEVLEKAPFDKPKTIYNIFEGPQLDEIFDIIDSFKKTAMVEDVAG